MNLQKLFVFLFLLFFLPAALQAQESPEAAYDQWVAASKAGDIPGLLAVSSPAKVKEFHQEFNSPQKQEEIRNLMKAMAPITYKVKKTIKAPDGNSASLFLDAIARDFFSLNDPKAKPEQENVEVRLVRENHQWKVDQQCVGKEGCGREPQWTSAAYGKNISLAKGASLKVLKGKPANFKGVPVKGEPLAVDLIFTLPEGGQTLSYFLHRNPAFADFYVGSGAKKITPIARMEDYPSMAKDEKPQPELKILEESTSYSSSHGFTGQGTLSLLFDLPKGYQGDKTLHLMVSYGETKSAFEVK
jgi:hypothetical protein